MLSVDADEGGVFADLNVDDIDGDAVMEILARGSAFCTIRAKQLRAGWSSAPASAQGSRMTIAE
jgi:hypothetical protein